MRRPGESGRCPGGSAVPGDAPAHAVCGAAGAVCRVRAAGVVKNTESIEKRKKTAGNPPVFVRTCTKRSIRDGQGKSREMVAIFGKSSG